MQPDLFDARAARDEAIAAVSLNAGEWLSQIMRGIQQLRSGWAGSGEALRLVLGEKGFPEPHHHNAWGAAIRHAITKGLLRPTGQYTHMKTRKSHARKTPVYLRP